jgi:hypothetical protein
MDLPAEGTEGRRILAGWDARAALTWLAGPYDQVVVDCYANQVEIPPHLASLEFFRELRARLRPGGWLSVNVSGFGLDDPVVAAVARTMAAAFEERALALRVPFAHNVVVHVRRDDEPPAPGGAPFSTPRAREAGARAIEGMWRWFEPAQGARLTDDLNPIEALQRRSILEAAGRLVGET